MTNKQQATKEFEQYKIDNGLNKYYLFFITTTNMGKVLCAVNINKVNVVKYYENSLGLNKINSISILKKIL